MILGGDWTPDSKNADLYIDVPAYLLANLEAPFLDHNENFITIAKVGPNLWTNCLPASVCNVIFSLANNHIMDYGLPGLEATLKSLEQRGFEACGAGKNAYDARQPIIVNDMGAQIGIIACCEAQFGVARPNSAGVAEFGPWVYDSIRELKKSTDAVVVSVHAAVEDSPWPSPYIQELYRSYIDSGATVIHGHHAHVPQGYEEYRGGVIFYGMGNLAVDPNKWRDNPNNLWSVGAEINFTTKPLLWRLLTLEIRYEQGSDSIIIEESTKEELASHKEYLELCNRPLSEPDLFARLWQEVALRVYYSYGADYMRFSAPPQKQMGLNAQIRRGVSILKAALLNRVPTASTPRQYDFLLWYNMIACESHRQMLTTALGVLGGEIKDLRNEETKRLVNEMIPLPRVGM